MLLERTEKCVDNQMVDFILVLMINKFKPIDRMLFEHNCLENCIE